MSDTVAQTELDTESFVPWSEFLASRYASSLALVCLAVWLHAADSLIVATMLPSMVADVGGASLIGWSISLYEIGSIVAGAASALMAMRVGLRASMAMTALLFGAGCIVSATAPTMPAVLVGRALQGLGGGGLVALGFVAIGVIFPRRYTARAIAAVSMLWGMSAFLGPLIGGVAVEYANWRWGFAFFAIQAFALTLWILLRSGREMSERGQGAGEFPVRRLALLCLAVVLVAFAGVEIGLSRTALFAVGGLACLGIFLWLDGHATEDRLLPLRPFDMRKPVGAALWMIFSLAVATIAITAFGPLLLTAIHGLSALTVGYIVAASSIGWSVTAVLSSGSPERHDGHLIAAGMAMVALSVVGFLYSVPNGPVWLVVFFSAIEGGGFGLAWTFILRRVTGLADRSETHRISGAIPTVQRMGYALGAAFIGIVANASGLLTMDTPDAAADVAVRIFFACLPFAVLGLVATAMFLRHPARTSHGLSR